MAKYHHELRKKKLYKLIVQEVELNLILFKTYKNVKTYYFDRKHTSGALSLFQHHKRKGSRAKLFKFWRGKWYVDMNTRNW